MEDLGIELAQGLAWGAVSIALLAIGYVVVDLLTPGKLGDLIYRDRNRNASVVAASGMLANAMIITTAILTSADGFVEGLVTTAAWGLIGIALLAVSFVVVDAITPGELGRTITEPEPHPAVWVTAAAHVSVGAVVAAAIS